MKRKGMILLGALLALFVCSLSGCRKYEQIRITSCEIKSVDVSGLRSVELDFSVGVVNPAGKVSVKNAEGILKHSGKIIGRVTLAPLILMPRTGSEYTVDAHVELSEGLGFKELMSFMNLQRLYECTVDVDVSGTVSGIAVRKRLHDIPLKELLENKGNEKI